MKILRRFLLLYFTKRRGHDGQFSKSLPNTREKPVERIVSNCSVFTDNRLEEFFQGISRNQLKWQIAYTHLTCFFLNLY